MKDLFFIVTDSEGKKLLDQFKAIHPEGNDFVFKLLLKFYIKFSGWHKKKGRNPIIAFQDLIEREINGKPYISDAERIRYLNEAIERQEDKSDSAKEGLAKEIKDLKNFLSTISRNMTVYEKPENFRPPEGIGLTKVEGGKPKERKNYEDIRGKGSVKKISF